MLRLTFSSKLDWGSYIISIVKTASKKIGALICSVKWLSPEVALYLYKSTQGIIQKKIWVHRFLAKPKTMKVRVLGGGAVSPPMRSKAMPWSTHGSILNNFAVFLVQHPKMVIVAVNIGWKLSFCFNPKCYAYIFYNQFTQFTKQITGKVRAVIFYFKQT